MQLSGTLKRYFGFDSSTNPFSDTPDGPEAIYRWPAFDSAVDAIVDAVLTHRFLVVCGNYCSSKSTAWMLARERLVNHARCNVLLAEPCGLDPREYAEATVYRAIVHDIGDGQALKLARAERAAQCKSILARHLERGTNERPTAAAFVCNDAHACRPEFLLICKRLWDQLDGFARLCAVILIGQSPLYYAVEREGEIAARREILILPGLGERIADYVRFECARCGADAAALFGDDAFDALGTLRGTKRFDAQDHPLRVSIVIGRALREAHRLRVKQINADLIAAAIRGGGEDDAAETGRARRGPRLVAD